MPDEQPKLDGPEETPLLEATNHDTEDHADQPSSTTEAPTAMPVTAPVAEQPAAATAPVAQAIAHPSTPNSPGVLVLQWLTYAFWGWTVLALSYLTVMSVGFFIDKSMSEYNGTESIAYALAAVVVLFVISFLCDFFYSKREPLHKTGAATVIMIIHAVIFALCGIGAVIVAVFAVVNMIINGAGEGATTALISGGIIAVVYAGTLLRTLRPLKLRRSAPLYWGFMALVVIAVTTLGIVGPAVNARLVRNDRLIEAQLPSLSGRINTYAATNDKLPASLKDVRSSLNGDAADMVDKNLVEYIPGKKIGPSLDMSSKTTVYPPIAARSAYSYQLCVTYKAAKNDRYSYDYQRDSLDTTPSTYSHAAGRVCYDLATRYVSSYTPADSPSSPELY